jgi:hypothetical protein
MATNLNLNDPKAISQAGNRIYQAKYRAEYEAKYPGRFVAINVIDETATLGDSPVQVLTNARREHPNGFFHLIRIGHPGAFEVGMSYRDVHTDRVPGY